MAKKYCFTFFGTKKMFSERISRYINNDKDAFRFHDYLIDASENQYRFGIARGGHSGGYWFVPQIAEKNGSLIIRGKIEYLTYPNKNSGAGKRLDKIEMVLLCLLLFPLILIIKTYQLIKKLINKVRHKPMPKAETAEDRLFYLMETILGCARIKE